MFTSDQIAQQIAYANQNIQPMAGAHSYAYGPTGSPAWRADSGSLGFTPWGPGLGDQVGGGAMRGMASAATLAGTVGTIGAAAKWAGIGPSWLHATRYAAGFGMGLMPGLAVGMGVPAALGRMAEANTEKTQFNNTIMQNFGNRMDWGGRGGLGPDRASMQGVTNMAREMAKLPELMTSFGEINRIMARMGDMQMLQGVKDASELNRRLSSTVKNLREISKVLGSTMEEALPYLAEARSSGIFNSKEQLKAVMNRQATTMMGMGASQQTLGGVQASGAQLAQQMGATRGVGAIGAMNTFQTLSVAQQMGILSEGRLSDLTGQTGEQGLAALTQITQGRLAVTMRDTGMGKLMSAALGETKDGRFTGQVDSGLARMMKEGKISKEEMLKLGQDKLTSKHGLASFQRNKGTLAFNAANEVGFDGVIAQIQEIMKDTTKGDEDIIALVAGQFLQGDQKLADTLMTIAKDMGKVEREKKSQKKKAIQIKLEQAVYKDKYTIGGQWERFKHGVDTAIGSPFDETSDDFTNYMGEATDNFVDRLLNRPQVANLTQGGASMMTGQLFNLAGNTGVQGSTRSKGGRVVRVGGSVVNVIPEFIVRRENRDLDRAAKGGTLASMEQGQKNTLDRMMSSVNISELQSDLRDSSSDGVNDQVDTLISHLKDKDEETYKALKSSGLSDTSIASAVQEKLGVTKENNKSFIDFQSEVSNNYRESAVLSVQQSKSLVDDMFHSKSFAFSRSVGSALGMDATFNDTTLQTMMKSNGPGKDLFLEFAVDGKIMVNGKAITTQEFLDASSGKLERIAEARGVSVQDLENLQQSLSNSENQKAIKDQSSNLKLLRNQKYNEQKNMSLEQLGGIATSLDKASITGDYSGDIKKLASGLHGIMNDDVEVGSKSAKEAVKGLADRLRKEKSPGARDKIKNDMILAGVSDKVISAIEEQASWMEKESGIISSKDTDLGDFLDKLGVSPESRKTAKEFLINSKAINDDNTITAEESKKAFEAWSQNETFSKLITPGSTSGLLAGEAAKIERDSLRLMVAENTKFVQAVGDVLGGKVQESADRLSKKTLGED